MVHYTGTSNVATARFFCQWYYENSEQRARIYEDLVKCVETVVPHMEERAPEGEIAEHHGELRIAFYEKHTRVVSDPTPSSPHCFKNYETLGCLFLMYDTDKGGWHGYHRIYSR